MKIEHRLVIIRCQWTTASCIATLHQISCVNKGVKLLSVNKEIPKSVDKDGGN